MGTPRQTYEPLPERARWDDLEVFQIIYHGVKNSRTIEEIGQANTHGFGNARALYRSLARLEKALNTQLVHRQRWSRETRVTAAGEKLYHQLEHILLLKQKLEEDIRSTRPVFYIATSESIAFHIMGRVLSAMPDRDQLPFELNFKEGNDWKGAIEILRRGDADIAILNVPSWVIPLADLRTKKIGVAHPWPLIVGPSHPFAVRYRKGYTKPVRLEELKNEHVAIHELYRDIFQPGKVTRSLMVVPRLASGPPLVRQGVAIAPWCEALARLNPLSDIVNLPMESSLSCISVIVYARHFPQFPAEPMKSFLAKIETVFEAAVEDVHQH